MQYAKIFENGSFLCTKSIFFKICLLYLSEMYMMAVTIKWVKMIVHIFKENSQFAQRGGG